MAAFAKSWRHGEQKNRVCTYGLGSNDACGCGRQLLSRAACKAASAAAPTCWGERGPEARTVTRNSVARSMAPRAV
jgi:hypothetical protein